MKLNVDLTELHKTASKMRPAKKVSLSDAFEAGRDTVLNGPNVDNCHFSYFDTVALSSEWERGRKSAESNQG